MKTHHPQTRGGAKPYAAWAGAAALAAVFLSGSSVAHAATPPAGLKIGNQATATYKGPNGDDQFSQSNEVLTTVLQVGAFTLDSKSVAAGGVVNTKTGSTAATIYAPHVLVNTGNGTDSFLITAAPTSANKFEKIEVFLDNDFDGKADNPTPLCTTAPSSPPTSCSVPAQAVSAGGKLGFVVAYTIPASAVTSAPVLFDSGLVTAVPQSSGLYTASNQTVTVQDDVTLTNVAAFNVRTSIAAPTVAAPGGGAWPLPTAKTEGQRSSGASCATAWPVSNSATCTYTTYTITYSNTGGQVGTFNLQDVIGTGRTAGFTYVTGSAVWSSSNSGVALDETGNGANGANVDFKYDAASKTLTFLDKVLPVSNERTLSFVVLVNSSATLGTGTTANVVTYSKDDAPTAVIGAPAGLNATSNESAFNVLGTYGVALGSAGATSANAKDVTAGAGDGTADTQTIAKAPAGSTIVFKHEIYNLGNGEDTFTIDIPAIGAAGNSFPAGTVLRAYGPDGTSVLVDSNNDGKIDTGPIAAGATKTIVIKATLSPTATPTVGANYTLTVTATSAADATKFDASKDVLTTVTGPAVDLTNSQTGVSNSGANADVGVGPSTQPTVTKSGVNAGSWTSFDLWITNNGGVADTYTLQAGGSSTLPSNLPSGWVVKFMAGPITAGSEATACPAGTAITSSPSVNANGGTTQVTACVFVPATQAPATQGVYFQVRAVGGEAGVFAVDTLYDQVTTVSAATTYTAEVVRAIEGQISPGGSLVLSHSITATGTGACGVGTVSVSFTDSSWTSTLYLDSDNDGQLSSADQPLTGNALPTLAAGQSVNLLVKVFAPSGATVGASNNVTVNVDFAANAPNVCKTALGAVPSVVDKVTVTTTQVQLLKTQILDATCSGTPVPTKSEPISAKPGECVVYRVVATNQGVASVSNIKLSDGLPAFTALGPNLPATKCESTGVTPALTNADWSSDTTGVSCGGSANTVNPGGTATMTFQVKLNSQ